jgi:nicotinate-nucleotide adenylyltransferase
MFERNGTVNNPASITNFCLIRNTLELIVGGAGRARVDSDAEGRDKIRPETGRPPPGRISRVQGFPQAAAGQTVGLLGGSFDPAHQGHAHITREALKRFRLDRVWWLVSPGNPLKARGPAPLPDRMARAREVMDHPRVVVSDAEARLGTRYTAATLQALIALYPGVRFVWLMGADNLNQFDQWENWEWIMQNVPIGVLARPGSRTTARGARAADIYARYRLPVEAAPLLARCTPPAWCLVNVPMVNISSSAIRARGDWRP